MAISEGFHKNGTLRFFYQLLNGFFTSLEL